MRLVLLPGMDGTGRLFEDILPALNSVDPLVIPLPNEGPQDYESLSHYVEERLPKEDIIVLAESFSGGIAAKLSTRQIPNVKGILFVASFLSTPMHVLPFLAAALPIQWLSDLPLSSLLHRWLFLGSDADAILVEQFVTVVKSVPNHTLRARLFTIGQCRYNGFTSTLPAFYLGASRDKLVRANKRSAFEKAYVSIHYKYLEGPHFLLQSQPQRAAEVILAFVHLLSRPPRHDT